MPRGKQKQQETRCRKANPIGSDGTKPGWKYFHFYIKYLHIKYWWCLMWFMVISPHMRSNEKLTQRAFIHARRTEVRYPWYLVGQLVNNLYFGTISAMVHNILGTLLVNNIYFGTICALVHNILGTWLVNNIQYVLWYNKCKGIQYSRYLVGQQCILWCTGAQYSSYLVGQYVHTLVQYVQWYTIFLVSGTLFGP